VAKLTPEKIRVRMGAVIDGPVIWCGASRLSTLSAHVLGGLHNDRAARRLTATIAPDFAA